MAAVVVAGLIAVAAAVVAGLGLAAVDAVSAAPVPALVLAPDLGPARDQAADASARRAGRSTSVLVAASNDLIVALLSAVVAAAPGAGQAGQDEDRERAERHGEQAAERGLAFP